MTTREVVEQKITTFNCFVGGILSYPFEKQEPEIIAAVNLRHPPSTTDSPSGVAAGLLASKPPVGAASQVKYGAIAAEQKALVFAAEIMVLDYYYGTDFNSALGHRLESLELYVSTEWGNLADKISSFIANFSPVQTVGLLKEQQEIIDAIQRGQALTPEQIQTLANALTHHDTWMLESLSNIKNAADLAHLAYILLLTNRGPNAYVFAIRFLKEAIKIDPNRALYPFMLGQAIEPRAERWGSTPSYCSYGDLHQTTLAYQKAVKLAPDNITYQEALRRAKSAEAEEIMAMLRGWAKEQPYTFLSALHIPIPEGGLRNTKLLLDKVPEIYKTPDRTISPAQQTISGQPSKFVNDLIYRLDDLKRES